ARAGCGIGRRARVQRERIETMRLGFGHLLFFGLASILGGIAIRRKIATMKERDPDLEGGAPPPDPLRRAAGPAAERGRGATFNPLNRFRREGREAYDDGWAQPSDDAADDAAPKLKTTATI